MKIILTIEEFFEVFEEQSKELAFMLVEERLLGLELVWSSLDLNPVELTLSFPTGVVLLKFNFSMKLTCSLDSDFEPSRAEIKITVVWPFGKNWSNSQNDSYIGYHFIRNDGKLSILL